MHLQPTPKLDHVLRVNAKLITSSTILHLTAEELERAIDRERIENPAFEVDEQHVCLFCGSRMYVHGQACTACGRYAQPAHGMSELPSRADAPIEPAEPAEPTEPTEAEWSNVEHWYDSDNYGFTESDRDDEFDPLMSIATGATLAETLLQQLEALVTPADAPIAEQLVGNLNERGYLEISVSEIGAHLQVPLERVEYVLSHLHTLEPLGIGARNVRECLLIQLQALSEQEPPHPLAFPLVDRYLHSLGRNRYQDIARELGVTEQEVRLGSHYIRTMLHPFPAQTYRADAAYGRADSVAAYTRPDVVIRKGGAGFEVELIEEKRFRFQSTVNTTPLSSSSGVTHEETQPYLHHYIERTRFFIDCVRRRWHTLKRVAELVCDYQHDFLERGTRYLRPLTRSEVAARLLLDEGTVSRATANKYVLLPNGRVMPFADFFDGSLSIKAMLRELIASEEPKRRLSDEELAHLLQAQGVPMARRTVTKYREEMGIGSSRER